MKLTRMIYLLVTLLFISITGCADMNGSDMNDSDKWRQWIANLRQQAIAQGIRADLFDRIFKDIMPQVGLIVRDQIQAKAKGNYYYYLKRRGDAFRIRLGHKEYIQHKALLEAIGKEYHVDPCYITAIWGIETVYGRYTGNYPIIASLATLAYDTRRSDYFREELLYALQIINGGHAPESNFKGAWDGGMGQPQFMPSSWHKFAVDYDNDGRKDIWYNYGDIFASIANYLAKHGWKEGEPYSVEVNVPAHFKQNLLDMNTTKTVKEWLALGVKIKHGQSMPPVHLPAALKQLDSGPVIMVFNNFKVILTYNKSSFYAGTVGYLANQICHKNY